MKMQAFMAPQKMNACLTPKGHFRKLAHGFCKVEKVEKNKSKIAWFRGTPRVEQKVGKQIENVNISWHWKG